MGLSLTRSRHKDHRRALDRPTAGPWEGAHACEVFSKGKRGWLRDRVLGAGAGLDAHCFCCIRSRGALKSLFLPQEYCSRGARGIKSGERNGENFHFSRQPSQLARFGQSSRGVGSWEATFCSSGRVRVLLCGRPRQTAYLLHITPQRDEWVGATGTQPLRRVQL